MLYTFFFFKGKIAVTGALTFCKNVLYCLCEQMFVLLDLDRNKEEEMEDKFLVAKTLLECYAHLDELYFSLTESAEACVRSGFYAIFPSEQMRLYDRLMAYEDRKIGLYNMKYLTEECFRRGDSAPLSLLKEKYINRLSKEEMIKKYGVCLRTCYRYLKKGLKEFTDILEKMGFDKKRMLLTFGDEPLFQGMLTRVIREDDREECEGRESAEREEKEINSRRNPLRPCNSGPDRSGPYDHSGLGRCCV